MSWIATQIGVMDDVKRFRTFVLIQFSSVTFRREKTGEEGKGGERGSKAAGATR